MVVSGTTTGGGLDVVACSTAEETDGAIPESAAKRRWESMGHTSSSSSSYFFYAWYRKKNQRALAFFFPKRHNQDQRQKKVRSVFFAQVKSMTVPRKTKKSGGNSSNHANDADRLAEEMRARTLGQWSRTTQQARVPSDEDPMRGICGCCGPENTYDYHVGMRNVYCAHGVRDKRDFFKITRDVCQQCPEYLNRDLFLTHHGFTAREMGFYEMLRASHSSKNKSSHKASSTTTTTTDGSLPDSGRRVGSRTRSTAVVGDGGDVQKSAKPRARKR